MVEGFRRLLGLDGGTRTGGFMFLFPDVHQFPVDLFLDGDNRHVQEVAEDVGRAVDADKGAENELNEV
jgi:hypothetical protein